mgnify:CR=1 FL=1
MKKGVFLTVSWLLVMSCGVKTEFSTQDLQWVNYQVGDSLIFSNEQGNFDTVLIVTRDVYYSEYNPIELHDKFHPQIATVTAKRPNDSVFTFVELQKKHPNKPAIWGIEIKFPGFFSSTDTIVNAYKNRNLIPGRENAYYQLSQRVNDINRFESNKILFISHIYLSANYEIVAYEMSSGEYWKRIR